MTIFRYIFESYSQLLRSRVAPLRVANDYIWVHFYIFIIEDWVFLAHNSQDFILNAKIHIISVNTKFSRVFLGFQINSYAHSLFFLCYPSAQALLFLCSRSRGMALSQWWNNVFFAKVQWGKVKFHMDIRKRQVKILLIAEFFVILHSIIKPWYSRWTRVVQKTSPRAFTFLQDCSQSHAKQRQNQRSSFM